MPFRSDPRRTLVQTYHGRLDAQIKAFKEALQTPTKRLPDKVLLILDLPMAILHGSETYASVTVSEGTVEFVLEGRSKRHRVEGFRHYYLVKVSPDGAIVVDAYRVPSEEAKPVPPNPATDCWF